jgi:protein phosphatase
MRNVITRSVGFEPMVEVETYEIAAEPGDTFLICSDGLTGMMEDWEVSELVDRFLFEDDDIESAVDRLIALANERGGHDNVTVCLTQIQ